MSTPDVGTSQSRLVLVLGGARSGKSRYAEALVTSWAGPWTYLATAQALDAEMEQRVAAHQAGRDDRWITVEAPISLGQALEDAPAGPVLVDCLTLWLTNLILGDHDVEAFAARLELALLARSGLVVLVANEVGLGIVPDNELARRFRDVAGLLNQSIAGLADEVFFIAAGLPLRLKG